MINLLPLHILGAKTTHDKVHGACEKIIILFSVCALK